MSNRTSVANKAIALAWSKEQQLVREGKGTRDWTQEQQRNILDRGKAYGDDGKSFEGHHMKSAEKHPEYQGDFENIQFLSRIEHFAAHDGNFQNPTNGYYNPFTGETRDFGLNNYVSCEILELSDPVISKSDQAQNKNDNTDFIATENVGNTKEILPAGSINISKKGFIDAVERFSGKVAKFYIRHKEVINPILITSALATAASVYESFNKNPKSIYKNHSDVEDYSSYDPDNTDITNRDIILRSSPSEHIVSKHGQHYHTKDGVIWKDKHPYPRGKNLDE